MECYGLVFLHALAGHSVDDGVPSRVHIPEADADAEHGEAHHDDGPQDDVEGHGVIIGVISSEVQLLLDAGLEAGSKEGYVI